MSVVDRLTGQTIPKKCLNIGIKKLVGPCKPLRIFGDPFHLCAFIIGDEFVACDYDQPENKLTQILRGRTTGPTDYNGWSCIETLEDQITPDGTPLLRSKRTIHVSNHFAYTILNMTKRPDGSGLIEPVHLELPLLINDKFHWNVWEKDLDSSEPQLYYQQVDGLYSVSIGKQSEQCLRWIRLRNSPPHPFDEAEEAYISIKTGLTILLQHYVGKGWSQLHKLKKSPKIEIKGHIFHLWFIRRILRDTD